MSFALSFSKSELAAGTKLIVRFSKNSVQQLHTKCCPANRSCMKIGPVKSCFTQECQWTATRNYHIRQPILMQHHTENFHLIPARSCQFSRCLCSLSRTLLRGVNEFMSLYFEFIARFFIKSGARNTQISFLKIGAGKATIFFGHDTESRPSAAGNKMLSWVVGRFLFELQPIRKEKHRQCLATGSSL
jgi:hypothetical protein